MNQLLFSSTDTRKCHGCCYKGAGSLHKFAILMVPRSVLKRFAKSMDMMNSKILEQNNFNTVLSTRYLKNQLIRQLQIIQISTSVERTSH